ncbi:MAG: tetratricopeptide repeat protein [Candidatus Electrothrix sp. LOE1_4_5]|nr:tetratricopeptide repeat protein [Candidatus Electrothrix gigas]
MHRIIEKTALLIAPRLGKFDKAVEAFRQSYDISERLEEERGQAMVLNSLGGVYQRQGKFDDAVKSFTQSAEIGERLGDNRHLAMVYTAWGSALLRQNQPAQAFVKLKRSFTIDEKMKNKRGMEIVTPQLCQALQQVGRDKKAASFCKRALSIASNNPKLLALQKRLNQPRLTGTIKFIKPSRDGNHSFGYITMDDGSDDVRFDSRYVDLNGLAKDVRVAVEVRTNRYGGRVARNLHKLAESSSD